LQTTYLGNEVLTQGADPFATPTKGESEALLITLITLLVLLLVGIMIYILYKLNKKPSNNAGND